MNCRNCGEEITEEMEFCQKCGLHLKYVSYQYTKTEVPMKSIFRSTDFYLKVTGIAAIALLFILFIYVNQEF